MAKQAMRFDSLKFANKLKAAGCDPKLAEAHATQQSEIIDMMTKKVITQDIFEQGLESQNSRFEKALSDQRHDLEAAISEQGVHFENALANQKHDFDTKIAEIKEDINNLGLKLTVRLGSLMAVGIGFLAVLDKL